MPWLVVLGSGSWSPTRGVRLEAGVHEVSEELAQAARDSGMERLVVSSTKPEVIIEDGTGPLTREDIVFGTKVGAVRLVQEDGEVEVEEVIESLLDEGSFNCAHCGEGFPSEAARGRHIWKEHTEASAPGA